MSAPRLAVERAVIEETVRLAALEVPGVWRVGRGGPGWRRWLAEPAVAVAQSDGTVSVDVAIVARPGQELAGLTRAVQASVGAAVERLLGLELGSVNVVVDGVGA